MKLVSINGLEGEKSAFIPTTIDRVVNVTDDISRKIANQYGPEYSAVKAVIYHADNTSVFYSTDTFDEVVSKIDAALDA